MRGVRERRYRVGTHTLSGIEAGECGKPERGVVVALHGSGYTSRYWDCPHDPSSSLLRLGSALGFRVVAVDRPGYGAARGGAPRFSRIDDQAEILGEFVAGIHADSGCAPTFLIGHSLGSLLAVRLAAREVADFVTGIDVVGLPVRWRPDVASALEALLSGVATSLLSGESRLAMYFGPPGTYDPCVLEMEASFSQRIPREEMEDSLASAQMLRELAPLIRVPIQYTVAEFEGSIAGGADALAGGRALFANSARVDARIQPNAGHNVSLHKVGRAYHLRALTFFDEAIACLNPLRPELAAESVAPVELAR